ncbi:IS3 family transposase [Frateuria sp.]|uniref:IS3 family transposase n=1 Tax=Frateuria sp. TaxID=2211372 RepID=UPI0039C8A2AA
MRGAQGLASRLLRLARAPESRRAAANRALPGEIRRVHHCSRGRYGSPRVHAALRAEGVRAGRHRVADLMRRHGTGARTKTRTGCCGSTSRRAPT